ncbi:hypothetical protein BDV25DRAFT_156252, partial [Aspergillus avenaceus]
MILLLLCLGAALVGVSLCPTFLDVGLWFCEVCIGNEPCLFFCFLILFLRTCV